MDKKSTNELEGVRACVFDAYGTLFDFAAAGERCRKELGEQTDALSEIWRTKQLQYTWLRSLMGHHRDFWQVTADALDFALDALDIDDDKLRERLLTLYMELGSLSRGQAGSGNAAQSRSSNGHSVQRVAGHAGRGRG